MCTARNIVTSM